jgi:MerR family copper efflux transcriptional regulator
MKELLNLWKNTDRQSADVKKLTLTHIETLNRKIAQLQDMVSLLQISADHCSGNENAECAILEDLEQGE